MTLRIVLLGAILTASPLHAARDERVRTQFYDPAAVVPITGRIGIQSTIEFAADERIENVAIGDSVTWQVTPNRRASLLFLKPVAAGRPTNMTVVTDRRTYMFDLATGAKGATPLYTLRFTYPEPPTLPAGMMKPAPTPVSLAEASPTRLNFAWSRKGTKRLMPERIFDDGHSVFLSWEKATEVPAMLTIGPDGGEGPVNYTVKDGYVVIDNMPTRLVLRSGRETASLDRIVAGTPLAQPATQSAER